jgi:hypothetical protein
MRSRDDQDRRIIHIGPDQDPADWSDNDDDRPSFLIQDARERLQKRERADRESSELARRLLYAFFAVVGLAVVFHVAMPAFGLYLPAIVPILCYVAILVGAVLTARDQNR